MLSFIHLLINQIKIKYVSHKITKQILHAVSEGGEPTAVQNPN